MEPVGSESFYAEAGDRPASAFFLPYYSRESVEWIEFVDMRSYGFLKDWVQIS